MGLLGGSDGKESACNAGDLGWEDPLEEGLVTHSRILAWKAALGLRSMGSRRVRHRHNLVTKHRTTQ